MENFKYDTLKDQCRVQNDYKTLAAVARIQRKAILESASNANFKSFGDMPQKINSGTGLPNFSEQRLFDFRNNVVNVMTDPSTVVDERQARSKSGEAFNVASDSQLENARSRLELILKDRHNFESINASN